MVLEKIRQLYPELTKSQKQLADFIATSYREAAFMTASRMARRLGLNEATVIRFAQRLGYPGYPQLIEDVQTIVQEELGAYAEEQEPVEEHPLVGMLKSQVDNLQRVVSHVTGETAERAIAMLRAADRVCILGQGAAAPLADLFCVSLRAVGIPSESPQADPVNLSVVLQQTGDHHLVIGLSTALESREVAKALAYARTKGAQTMALTWSHISPSAQAADLAISYLADDSFPLGTTTPLAILIDALVQTIAAEAGEAHRLRTEECKEISDLLTTSS